MVRVEEGKRGGGWGPMGGLGTDHVISAPMRGLDGAHTQATDGQCDLDTESAQWAKYIFIHDKFTTSLKQ